MILMKEIIDCIKSGEKDRAIVLVGDAQDMDVREAKRYVDEYRAAKRYADSIGFSLLFGVEVTLKLHGNAHVLLYGISEDFVLRHPSMHLYTHEQLYRLVKEEGGAFVQAHPLRGGGTLLDLSQLDGIELSCHPLYEGTMAESLLKTAKENNLAVTCGGDYHADTYRAHCGMYLDESISDTNALAKHLLSANEFRLKIHEVNTDTPYDLVYVREAK